MNRKKAPNLGVTSRSSSGANADHPGASKSSNSSAKSSRTSTPTPANKPSTGTVSSKSLPSQKITSEVSSSSSTPPSPPVPPLLKKKAPAAKKASADSLVPGSGNVNSPRNAPPANKSRTVNPQSAPSPSTSVSSRALSFESTPDVTESGGESDDTLAADTPHLSTGKAGTHRPLPAPRVTKEAELGRFNSQSSVEGSPFPFGHLNMQSSTESESLPHPDPLATVNAPNMARSRAPIYQRLQESLREGEEDVKLLVDEGGKNIPVVKKLVSIITHRLGSPSLTPSPEFLKINGDDQLKDSGSIYVTCPEMPDSEVSTEIMTLSGMGRELRTSSPLDYNVPTPVFEASAITAVLPVNDDERVSLRKQLEACQKDKQRQQIVAQKLQEKLLQQRQSYQQLEEQYAELSFRLQNYERNSGLDENAMMQRFIQEKERADKLTALNEDLNQQLERCTQESQSLASNLLKLDAELKIKEEEWKCREEELQKEAKTYYDRHYADHEKYTALWWQIVSFRKEYSDMQTGIDRDLKGFSQELTAVAKLAQSTFGNLRSQNACPTCNDGAGMAACWESFQNLQADLNQGVVEKTVLMEKIDSLARKKKELDTKLNDKEEVIRKVTESLSEVETKNGMQSGQLSVMYRVQEECIAMQSVLRSISQLLVDDSIEELDESSAALDVPRSPLLPSRVPRTPRASPAPLPNAGEAVPGGVSKLAEGTHQAVAAALFRRKQQVQELQVKLEQAQKQLTDNKRHVETLETSRMTTDVELHQLRDQLAQASLDHDGLNLKIAELTQELEASKREIATYETSQQKTNLEVTGLRRDKEELYKSKCDLQNQMTALEETHASVEADFKQCQQSVQLCNERIATLEDTNRSLKEELGLAQNELDDLRLVRDSLQQQKLELESTLGTAKRSKSEWEAEAQRWATELIQVREKLSSVESTLVLAEKDKANLNAQLTETETARSALAAAKLELRSELETVKDELARAEKAKSHLEDRLENMQSVLNVTQEEKEKVGNQTNELSEVKHQLTRRLHELEAKYEEMVSQSTQLSKEKTLLTEEINKSTRSEELAKKERSELLDKVAHLEQESRRLREEVANLNSAKQTVELSLFAAQTELHTMQEKETHLTTQLHEILQSKETLFRKIADLQNSSKNNLLNWQSEKDKLLSQIANLQEQIRLLNSDKESLTASFEKDKEELRSQLETQLNQQHQRWQKDLQHAKSIAEDEIKHLKDQLALHDRLHEEALQTIDNENKLALNTALAEYTALQERLQALQLDLESARGENLRLQRADTARTNADRLTITGLRGDVTRLQAELHSATTKHREERQSLLKQLAAVEERLEEARTEIGNLQSELQAALVKHQGLQQSLSTWQLKYKDMDQQRENLQQTLNNIQRSLSESQKQADGYQVTAQDVRNSLLRTENEKSELTRLLEETQAKLASDAEARKALEQECLALKNSLKDAQSQLEVATYSTAQLERQLNSLKAQAHDLTLEKESLSHCLHNEKAKNEEAEDAVTGLKDEVSILRAECDHMENELRNARSKAANTERHSNHRIDELQGMVDSYRMQLKTWEDQTRSLELALKASHEETDQTKLQLKLSESKNSVFEQQIRDLEFDKTELRSRLNSVMISLRKVVGVREWEANTSANTTANQTRRRVTASPVRRLALANNSAETLEVTRLDFDTDTVQTTLHDLVKKMSVMEQEKEEAELQRRNIEQHSSELRRELLESQTQLKDSQKVVENKQRRLLEMEKELAAIKTSLLDKEASDKEKNQSAKKDMQKLHFAEAQLKEALNCKTSLEDEIARLRASQEKKEEEIKNLRSALANIESQSLRMEYAAKSGDGEVQRMQRTLREKDMEIQLLQSRLDDVTARLKTSEMDYTREQSANEKLTVQINDLKARETDLRMQLAELNSGASDRGAALSSTTDKLRQLQDRLSIAEQEKRKAEERANILQDNLRENREDKEYLQNRIQQLLLELSQLKTSGTNSEAGGKFAPVDKDMGERLRKAQQEKLELQGSCNFLKRENIRLQNELWDAQRKMFSQTNLLSATHDKTLMELSSSTSKVFEAADTNSQMLQLIRKVEENLQENRKQNMSSYKLELDSLKETWSKQQKFYEDRETDYRAKIKRLEKELAEARQTLSAERKRTKELASRMQRAGSSTSMLRSELHHSLRAVSAEPKLDANDLHRETVRLEGALSHYSSSPSPTLPINFS